MVVRLAIALIPLFLLVASPFASSTPAQSATWIVTLKVEGMT